MSVNERGFPSSSEPMNLSLSLSDASFCTLYSTLAFSFTPLQWNKNNNMLFIKTDTWKIMKICLAVSLIFFPIFSLLHTSPPDAPLTHSLRNYHQLWAKVGWFARCIWYPCGKLASLYFISFFFSGWIVVELNYLWHNLNLCATRTASISSLFFRDAMQFNKDLQTLLLLFFLLWGTTFRS